MTRYSFQHLLIHSRKIQLITIGIILLIATCIIIPTILLTKESTQTETTLFIPHTTRTTTRSTTKTLANNVIRNWNQYAISIAGGNGQGNKSNQLSLPVGIYIDDDDDHQTIYIADSGNNRIVQWKSNATDGRTVAGGNGNGNNIDQLSNPTDMILDKRNKSIIICDWGNARIVRWSIETADKGEILISNRSCFSLAVDNERYLYVSNPEENEIRKWKLEDYNYDDDDDGILVAGGNGVGNDDNQLSYPTFIFLNENSSLYISDRDNRRIMKWLKNTTKGITVVQHTDNFAWKELDSPSGVIVDHFSQIFTADSDTNRVLRWNEAFESSSIAIVGFGKGVDVYHLHRPHDISFDRDDNLYVVDTGNHRIQKFLFYKY